MTYGDDLEVHACLEGLERVRLYPIPDVLPIQIDAGVIKTYVQC